MKDLPILTPEQFKELLRQIKTTPTTIIKPDESHVNVFIDGTVNGMESKGYAAPLNRMVSVLAIHYENLYNSIKKP